LILLYLNHNQNFVQILYKGINVKSEGRILYKYRLEGLDSSWTYSENTFVQYTTLPPGSYKFIVYALNSDGQISSNPAEINFIIHAPFWKTWWFYAALLRFYFYFNLFNLQKTNTNNSATRTRENRNE
jgi:hypothetical protein